MKATKSINNFLRDNIEEDFILICEQLEESEFKDGYDIDLGDFSPNVT